MPWLGSVLQMVHDLPKCNFRPLQDHWRRFIQYFVLVMATPTNYDAPSAVPGGVWCPVVSLYKDSPRQEIDLEASYAYFSYIVRGGVNGLVLQGSTAEAALLSAEEKRDLTRTARKAVSDLGVPDFPIAAGISGQSTNETLQLSRDAAASGATFGLLLPPSYWPKAVTNDVLVDYYWEVASHSAIPIICYNVRALSPGSLSLTLMACLSFQALLLASTSELKCCPNSHGIQTLSVRS